MLCLRLLFTFYNVNTFYSDTTLTEEMEKAHLLHSSSSI